MNKKMAVIFKVGRLNTKLFKCDKSQWCKHSSFIANKFKTATTDVQEISLPDIEPKTFTFLLKYINSGELKICDIQDIMDVYVASKTYKIISLEKECKNCINQTISLDNLCYIYDIAIRNNLAELKNECQEMVNMNASKILNHESFLSSSSVVLYEILSNGSMNVFEKDVFDFLLKWARAENLRTKRRTKPGSLRRTMDPYLKFIRFLAMSPKDFVRGPGLSNIFTHDEESRILMNILVPKCKVLPSWCNKECRERGNRVTKERRNSC